MEKLQGFTDHVMLYVKTLVKWLLAAALIGTVGGAVGSLFHLGVEYATELRTEVPALLYALPLAGVLIVALYRFLRTQGVGTNAVLDAVHQGRELPILLIPAIFLATLLTHLAGGSAGREGAALQIGGDLGEHFGKMLRMDDKDCRLATLCGMSALFSALFGTPLAAVFFALEVVSIGVLYTIPASFPASPRRWWPTPYRCASASSRCASPLPHRRPTRSRWRARRCSRSAARW